MAIDAVDEATLYGSALQAFSIMVGPAMAAAIAVSARSDEAAIAILLAARGRTFVETAALLGITPAQLAKLVAQEGHTGAP